VAGIVLSKRKNDILAQKYGSVDAKTVIEGIAGNEAAIGYTDALTSSEGLNFILTALNAFDQSNPLSDGAVSQFRKLQDNVPYVAYDAAQLKDSALGGTLDGFVSDCQAYSNSPDLKSSYVFIPFGVRQDQPVYEVGELSALKKQISQKFIAYCKTPEAQKSAADKGFGGLEDYKADFSTPTGSVISQIQETWKKEKNGSSDLTAVFVADISGSMEGSPLLKLKASLNRASAFIDSNTNIGFVTFSDNVNIALPIAKFDLSQKAYFSNAVKSIRAGGGTAMFDAVVAAEKMLVDAKDRNPNTKLMLFVLTDGESNRGCSFKDIEKITKGIKIPIYTIGYNANIDVLRSLSDINEAATMNAETDNVIYKLESLFNSQI
jgi:Ca-activated chloride channel family protein